MASNTRLLIIAIIVSADAGFQAGHSSWVLNGCKRLMREFIAKNIPWNLSAERVDLLWSFFVTLRIIGQILGAEMARPVVDRYGRRFCLRLNAVNFLVSNLLQFLSTKYLNSVSLLFIGRILQCAGVGIAQISLSIFITEISPNDSRGRNASFYNVFIGLGSVVTILAANSNLLGNEQHWPFVMLLPVLSSAAHFLLSWLLPESPKFLIGTRQRLESGERSLKFYRNGCGAIDEFDQVLQSMEAEREKGSTGKPSICKLVKNNYLRKSITIMLVVSTARALSGYHVMFSYSTFALEQAGMAEKYAQWATLGVATLRFLLSLPLSYLVEKVGRRPLMIYTSWGTLSCFILLMAATLSHEWSMGVTEGMVVDGQNEPHPTHNLPLTACIALVAEMVWPLAYNFGIGPIPRFIVAEIFPQSDRALAQKLSVQWDCAVSFVFTFLYLPGFHRVGGWIYMVIILPLLPLSIFITGRMPETKNKDISTILDEICHGGKGEKQLLLNETSSDYSSESEDTVFEGTLKK